MGVGYRVRGAREWRGGVRTALVVVWRAPTAMEAEVTGRWSRAGSGQVCTGGDSSACGWARAAARWPGAQQGDGTGAGQAFTVASCLQPIDSCSFPKKPNHCWGKSVPSSCKNTTSSYIEK